MSRQAGFLNCSFFYQSNLQRHDSLNRISDFTSSPLPGFSSNSPRMDSDASNQTVFNTNSNFNTSEVETSDEILDSEPSPPNVFEPLF